MFVQRLAMLATLLLTSAAMAPPLLAQDAPDPFEELQRLVGPPPPKAPPVRRPAPAPRAPGPAAPPEIDTSYQPDMMVRQRVETLFVQQIARTDPVRAQGMAVRLRSVDIFQDFDRREIQNGLRPNHLADAMAAYWLLYWTTATNYGYQITRQQAEAVRNQVSRSLGPTFRALDSDEKRQSMAELVILRALNIAALADDARRAGLIPAQRNVANMAAAEFQNVGIDLRALDLTPAGFKKRS